MPKITREVNINYIATGLQNIIKAFEKLDPSQLSVKAQKASSDITNAAKVMLDQINLAMQKGDISEEMARKYEKMFQSFIGSDFDRQFKAVLQGVGGDFDAAFSGMTAKAAQLAQELANIESTITVEQKGFAVEGDKVDFATQTKKNEVAVKALQEVLKENNNIELESLTRAKNKLPTYANLEQNQERVNNSLSKMSDAQRKNIANFLETGTITEANAANVDLLVNKMEGNLSVQEVQQRLQAKKLIDEKLEIELQNQKNKLKDLENQKIQKTNELKQARDPVKTAKEEVEAQKQVNQAQQTYNKNQAAVVEILDTVGNSIEESKKQHEQKQQVIRSSTKETERNSNAVKNNGSTFTKAANQVFNYGLAFGLLRRVYRETLRTIRDLDKALTEMAIVTTMSRKEAFGLADTMASLARETGFTTTEIAKLSTIYFRQGRALSEVIELTRVAAQAARIAGISAAESANFLTSAINAFQFSADQALAVSDKFAAIAASSASSYQELAVGLSKFAAQANVAGVSIDFAMGLLAKGIEVTREAPETIGTALKTVIARMRELTDLGKTFEDGMDISRVDTALRQVGVTLRDQQGQFRDLELVLTELGQRWGTLNRNQQASIAVSLAGTRQQSRLIAIMQDFDRTLELVDISQQSAGATTAQQVQFMQSLEAATVQLQTAYQDFIRTIGETEIIIGIVKLLTFLIDGVSATLEMVGFSGKNATVILVGLFVVLKGYKILLAITKGIQGLYANSLAKTAAAQGANTIATGIATKGIVLFNLALIKTILIIAPIAIAIGLLVIGLLKLAGSQERANKKFEENTKILEANNYEINRSLNNMRKLRDEIERLESLSFLTPEQSDQLTDLQEKLAETVGEEFFERLSDGTVDWKSTLEKLVEFEANKLQELRDNRKALLDLTLDSINLVTVFGDVEVGPNGKQFRRTSQELEETLTPEQRRNFANVFVGEYTDLFGSIGNDIELQFRDVIRNLDFSVEDITNLRSNPKTFIKKTVSPIMKELENFNALFEDETMSLADRSEIYNDKIVKIANPNVRKVLEKQFSDLQFILDTGLSLVLLEAAGITDSSQIQSAFEVFGTQTDSSLKAIVARAKELEGQGFKSGEALRIAFSQASLSTEDATAKVWLYNQAFQQTTLEAVQGLDNLTSRIERVDKVQKDWLEGTISYQDLFNFFEDSSDLFKDMDDVERFLSGESMQADAIIAKVNAQKDLVVDLYHAWSVYNDETSTADERQDALVNIALLSTLTSYKGELTSLTEEQHKFNASLREYELFSSLGVDTSQLSTRLLQEQAVATGISTQKLQDRLLGLRAGFSEVKDELELEGEFDDYFRIINGQIVPVFENLEGLTAGALTYIDDVLKSYQGTLNEAFEEFKAMREQSLKIEKENLDKQKKVYEDYFSALDRLEQQRERKLSRENLVNQLSRLEGATDERSRQRALELRRELNQLDEQQAQDTQTQARESLLSGFDERYAELERRWAAAAQVFIEQISNVGEESGNAFANAINSQDITKDLKIDATPVGREFDGFVDKMKKMFENIELPSIVITTASDVADKVVTDDGNDHVGDPMRGHGSGMEPVEDTQEQTNKAAARKEFNDWMKDNQRNLYGQKFDPELRDQFAKREELHAKYGIDSFRKGGMVDFEGLAMLHGSKSSPEAVLNPMQTEMFIGLRDALEKVTFNSNGSGGSVNIENISISTASLNNNQDFNRAGETLAEAFKHAIQRKGITVNTNKV